MAFRRDPLDCIPGDTTDASGVRDWPKMTNKQAVAFKRWCGLRTVEGQLVREGNQVFEVGESALALCRYNHSRQF